MRNNYIFIDESGSLGNQNVFIICLVIIKNSLVLKEIDNKINNFKFNYFKDFDVELHFNKESSRIKRNFFNIFDPNDFTLRYLMLRKGEDRADYQYIVQGLIENKDLVINSIIFIDGFNSRLHNKKMVSKIRKQLRLQNINIKSIKYIDSKDSPLIQLADMCAGCIRRKFERNRVEDNELFATIEKFMK